MAVDYSIPPWLAPRGGTPAESYARGFALGEQRRQAQAQVAARMQEAQMQAASQAQAQQQRAAIAQAELAAETQKQQQLAEVAREELAIKKAAQSVKDREAAGVFASEEDIRTRIAAGEDPQKVYMGNPRFFRSNPSAYSSAINATKPPPTPTVREFPGGKIPPAVQMGDRLQWAPGAGAVPGEELFSTRDVTNKVGQVIGTGIVTGPKSGSFRETKPTAPDFVERGLATAAIARIKQSEAALEKEKTKLPYLSKSPKMKEVTEANIARLQESIKADKAELESMRKTPKSSAIEGGGEEGDFEIPNVQAATPTPTGGGTKAQQRVNLAKKLNADHPDWTREQIIAEARKQIP